jgi:hypothetical protein
VALLVGGGVGVWIVTDGGVKPNGVATPMAAALVALLVEVVKYLINICGTMTESGLGPGSGTAAESLALYSSGGPLVTATLVGGALVGAGSGGLEGIGGGGRIRAAGGGTGAWACSATGGGGTRKRKGMGPACGK